MADEQLICSGCGIPIQTVSKDQAGYAPPASLEREAVICQRCYRLKHYGEVQHVPLEEDNALQILDHIAETDALIVKIVDIFDFDGSWLPGITRFAGNNNVILAGNKIDLLPTSTNMHRLREWMRRSAKGMGLKPKDVFLFSGKTGEGTDELAAGIDAWRAGKDVYIVGSTNVGKSTFINNLIQEFAGDERFLITTSWMQGTTLNLLDFPLDDGCTLYDTPGIINRKQMAHVLTDRERKAVMPQKEIKPKVYQLDERQTLFFAGLARLDYIQGGTRSFVCYFSNTLYIHRTKLEKADELYANQLGELLQPPDKKRDASFPTLVHHDFTVKTEKVDIVFHGLGWVTVHGGRGQVRAYAPEGIEVSIRESLI